MDTINENSQIWTPHPYQERAVQFALEEGCVNLWIDPGLGKTSITLEMICRLRQWDKRPVLVVCPLRPAYLVWPRERDKWTQFNHLSVQVLHGPEKDQRLRTRADIYVINFAGLKWLVDKLGNRWPFSVLVLDESTAVKNTSTKRFEALSHIAKYVPRRLALTGTPAPNSLIDIFGPQFIIDRGATFGNLISKYRNKYFQPSGYMGYTWRLQEHADDLIYNAIAHCTLRLEARDYIAMPDLIENDVKIDLPPDARKQYTTLEHHLITQLESGTVTAVNGGVAIMKCQQVANGAIYLDRELDENDRPIGPRQVENIHDEKIAATEEILAELSGKGAIIAYHFAHDLEKLKKAIPKALVLEDAKNEVQILRMQDAWNSGAYEALLMHPMSGSHGLNLQEHGSAVIWYSNTYSSELYDQLNARLVRQGAKNSQIVIHRLIATQTVDEDIVRVLRSKSGTQTALLDAIKTRNNLTAISG